MIEAQDFDNVIKIVRPYTVFSPQGLRALWDCAKRTIKLEGDMAELGVYNGGSCILIALACPGKTIHAFDTFTGIPNISSKDRIRTAKQKIGHANGDFAVEDLIAVRERLEAYGIKVHVGLFSEISSQVADRHFCFSHCDADTFISTMEFLEFFYPRTVHSGYMIFDDYLWPSTPGVEKAIHSFLADKPEKPIVVAPYQCVVVKQSN